MKLSKAAGFLLGSLLLVLAGCGSPYLEKGFESEADYEFAESANLSPVGVDRFKKAGVSNPSQYREAVNEMHVSGYSNSNEVDDVLEYARDRFEGTKTGVTALQRKNARIAEAARIKAAKLEAERLEAQRRADEKAAQDAAAKAKEEAEEREVARKRLESEKYVRARWEALRKAGIYETDVLNLIVNFQSFKGKKVFLKCWINNMSSYGGNCRSSDDKQYVSIDNEGIDKEDFKWLLENCRNQYYNENSWYCRSAPVVATVDGSSVPRLTNVYFYELCKKRTEWSSRWSREREGCSLED
jgi:hypothetical protein